VLRAAPNPFHGAVVITCEAARHERIEKVRDRLNLEVYDVQGRKIALLAEMATTPGEQRFCWDARTQMVPDGVYFVRLLGEASRPLKLLLNR
jgi:hypothetical protein